MKKLRTDWAKRARSARRHMANMITVDPKDLGSRPGIERVFGLDGPVWAVDGCVVQPATAFRLLAHRWMSR